MEKIGTTEIVAGFEGAGNADRSTVFANRPLERRAEKTVLDSVGVKASARSCFSERPRRGVECQPDSSSTCPSAAA